MSLIVFSVQAEQMNIIVQSDTTSKADFKVAYTKYQDLAKQDKWSESLKYAKKAYELGLEVYTDKPETRAVLADNYALNLMKLNQFEQATPVLEDALSFYEKIHGLDSPELLLTLLDLSRSLAKRKSGKKFDNIINRAINISAKHYNADSAEHGSVLVDTANIYATTGKINKVKSNLEAGYYILSNTLGENHPKTGTAAYGLGSIAYLNKQFNKSVKYYEAALKSFEFPDEPSNAYELKAHSRLILAYENLNQRDNATRHCLAIGRMTPRTQVQDYLPLLKIAPIYPARAAERGIQGEVTVKYDVDESGFVINPVIVKNTTKSTALEKASINAALKFRYAPGFEDGKPVLTKGVHNRFTYRLSW